MIGFAVDMQSSQRDVALLGLADGMHYTIREDLWFSLPSQENNVKRYARISHEVLIDALDHRLTK